MLQVLVSRELFAYYKVWFKFELYNNSNHMYITGSGAPIWVVWSGLILTINLGSVDVIFYVFHERKKTKYSIDDNGFLGVNL